jgi:hypothetical protein
MTQADGMALQAAVLTVLKKECQALKLVSARTSTAHEVVGVYKSMPYRLVSADEGAGRVTNFLSC